MRQAEHSDPSRWHASTRVRTWVLALALLALAATVLAETDIDLRTPAATVQSLQRGLIEVAAAVDLTIAERYAQLLPLVTATHDLDYVARLAVRRQWEGFDAAERLRYLEAFKTLSVMTYANRFGGVASDSFVAVTTRSESDDGAEVVSAIRAADGEEISLDYVLRRGDAGWRIINILADGVSDLALKRAEYRRILGDGSPGDLIAELERQTDALRDVR